MTYGLKHKFAHVMFMWHPSHAPHWPVFGVREDSGRIGRVKWVNSDTENDAWGRCWWGK